MIYRLFLIALVGFGFSNLMIGNSGVWAASLVKLPSEKIPSLSMDDADLGSWEAGSKAQLKLALTRQIERCKVQISNTPHVEYRTMATRKVSRAEWCVKPAEWFLSKIDQAASLQDLFLQATHELEWYQSTGKTGKGDMLFTGYYYPEIKVKLKKDGTYKFPIYKIPADGKLPQFTRAEVASGALNGKKLELGYADNAIEPYFLEVQGSGALLFLGVDGTVQKRMLINFAGTNGHNYVSIGRLMREAGVPESYINMQGIKRYFTENPQLWRSYSDRNPSFVYFKESQDGPFGSSGAILTPKHSIAVDANQFPLGAIALVQTERPAKIQNQQTTEWKSFAQFMIAQDTGGAIQTPGRVDLYYGSGDYAQVAAGQTQNPGALFFVLVPEAKKELAAVPAVKGQTHLK